MKKVYIKDKQDNKVLPYTHVDAVLDDEGNSLSSHLGAFEDEVRGLVDTPHQEYVTVATYASLPASGSKDTIYRVSNYDGSQSHVAADVYSEYAWDGTQYVFLCVKSAVGEVFDITVYNNNTKYANLSAALGVNGVNIPESLRKGGMSVKYVQSSDNKYVQFRCMAQNFTTDVTQWQGVDDEPTAGSNNLVKSGGVFNTFGVKGSSKIKDTSIFSIPNTYINKTTGEPVTYNNWVATPYIVFDSTKPIKYYGKQNGSNAGIAFYDDNLQVLSGGVSATTQEQTITPPSDAVYFRASGIEGAYVTYVTPNNGVNGEINILQNLVLSRNVIYSELYGEPHQWANLNNYSVGDELSVVSSVSTIGVFKECSGGDVFYVHSEMGSSYPRYCFVDSDNIILAIGTATNGVYESFIVAPQNTAKILFMTNDAQVSSSYIFSIIGRDKYVFTTLLNNNTTLNLHNLEIALLKNKTENIPIEVSHIDDTYCTIDGYGVKATGDDVGSLAPYAGWAASDYIEFDATKPFRVKGKHGSSFGIAFYSTKNENACVGGTLDYNIDVWSDITIPSGAVYFRFCNAYGNNWHVYIQCSAVAELTLRNQVIENTNDIKALANNTNTKLNILAIGNSFTMDSVEYLRQSGTILDSINANNINIYWAIMGGSSLQYWWQQLENGNITPSLAYGSGMAEGEYYDYIVIQQVSKDAADYSTFIPYLYKVMERLKQYNSSKTKIVFNMVWSRGEGTDSGSGVPYVEAGWERIVATIRTMMADYSQSIVLVLPTGTAVQNGRGNNSIDNGHGLTRDGQHLSSGTGRYIAASLWYTMLIEPFTRVKLTDITVNYDESIDPTVPEKIYDGVSVDNSNRLICQKCALYASVNPFTLSQID